MVAASLAGLPAFAAYLALSAALCAVYVLAYTWLTPMDERSLIAHGGAAAAVALGLSLAGFAVPLASAIVHSAHLVDCLVWGVVALLVQVLAYFLARIYQADLAGRISRNDMAAAVWLGSVSLVSGILSAACMSSG